MRRQTLAANHLFAWAKLNGVEFNNIHIKTNIPASDGSVKGAGLVSANDARANEDGLTLMSVPQELVLTQERVHRYAAIDKHLKLVLDAAGAFGRVRARTFDRKTSLF